MMPFAAEYGAAKFSYFLGTAMAPFFLTLKSQISISTNSFISF